MQQERYELGPARSLTHHQDTDDFPELTPSDSLTIDQVSSILDLVIKSDEATKKILFLLSLLTYTEDSQTSIAMKGESAIGKSWIALRIMDLHPAESKMQLNYSSPTSFFHELGTYDEEKHARIIDFERKIICWLDMPNPKLLERLRPLASHDTKER